MSLVELLATVPERTPTVRMTVRRWHDMERLTRILLARGLMQPLPQIPPEEGPWERTMPAEFRSRTTIWLRRPDRMRVETVAVAAPTDETLRTTIVVAGDRSWDDGSYVTVQAGDDEPGQGSTWVDEQLLVEPAALVGALVLEEEGTAEAYGRPAIRARGTRRPLATPYGQMLVGFVTDEVELLVDRDTGLVLYLGRRSEGETYESLEVVELELGMPLDDALFEPPR